MKGQTFRRWAGIAVFALVLCLALFLALRKPPISVDYGEVSEGPLIITIDEDGETRVREVYVVSAPVTGRLLRITQDVGDPVSAGETVLATIQPSEPTFLDIRSQSEAEAQIRSSEATLSLAQAEVERATAERDFAQNELKRMETLFQTQTVAEAAVDRARMQFSSARAALASAQAAVDVADHELERAQAMLISPQDLPMDGIDERCCTVDVRSPITGRLLRLIEKSEAVLPAGAPLLEVGNPQELEIVVDLLSSDAVRVKPSASVSITDWGGGEVLTGRVRRIEPFGFTKISALGVEEQRVNVIIDFMEPNDIPEALGHGFRVEVKIEEWRTENSIRIPEAALFRQGDDWSAFIVQDGVAEQRLVSIGRSNGDHAQVIDGIEAGEIVILYPSEKIESGMRVKERPR